MSMPNPVAKLQEVKQFLVDKRDAPSVQLKILLRPKTSELAKVLNGFINNREMDPEEKLEMTIDALGTVTEIEQYIPHGDDFLNPRMKYAAFGNFLRNSLVSSFSHSNIARNYSSASILSNLLIDQIIHIDELPEFPSYQNPEAFIRQFGSVFNIIVSTAGVYTSLLRVLPIINKHNIDEWFSQIFKYMKLYKELFKKFNVTALLSSKKVLEPEKLITNVYNAANTQFTLIENMIQAYQIYQGELPDHLLDYGIVDDNSTDSFIAYLDYIDNAKDTITGSIDEAKSRRYISMNLDISDSPFVKQFITNSRLLESFKIKIKIYDGGIYGAYGALQEFVDSRINLLQRYVKHMGSVEEVVNSGMVVNILEDMKDTLQFISLLAVENEDKSIYFDFIKTWELLFKNYSFEKANEVALIKLLSDLFIKTKLNLHIDYSEIEELIETNIDHVALQPRIFVTLSLLQIIARLYQGKPVERESDLVLAMFEIGCPEGDSWYKDELEHYLDYLLGEKELGNLTHRKEIIFLDTYSWLIPNLTNKPLPLGRKIEYLPFNRKSDTVV